MKLNTLQFIPSHEIEKPFSVVFFMNGCWYERRFENKEYAEKFAEPWIKKYKSWTHRPIEEWVSITESPLYLRIDSKTGIPTDYLEEKGIK